MEQHKVKSKDWNDVLRYFAENQELGAAFYNHFESRRDELIAIQWTRTDPNFDKKCHHAAQFIQVEILDDSGLKHLTRK